MKRRLAMRFFGLVAGMVLLAVLWLRSERAGDIACSYARRQLPRLAGRTVQIGACRLDPLRSAVELIGVSVVGTGADEPDFAVDRVRVRLRPIQAFAGRVRIDRVELDRPRVRVTAARRSAPMAPSKDCALGEALDRVEIGNLHIDAGRVEVTGGGLGVVVDGVSVRAALAGPHLELSIGGGQGEVVTPVGRVPLTVGTGWMRLAPRTRNAEGALALESGDAAVTVSGRVANFCDPAFDVTVTADAAIGAIAKVAGLDGQGRLRLRAQAKGTPAAPAAEIEASFQQASLQGYALGDAQLKARVTPARLSVERLDVPLGEGLARIRGEVQLEGRLPTWVEADLREVPLGLVLSRVQVPHAWADLVATGRARVNGQMLRPFGLSGEASVAVADFVVRDHGWDQPRASRRIVELARADITATLGIHADRVHIGAARVVTPSSLVEADVTLHYDPVQGLNVDAKSESLDLGELRHVAEIPVAGRAEVQATVAGPYKDVAVEGLLAVRDARVHTADLGVVSSRVAYRAGVLAFPSVAGQKGRSPYFVRGELDFLGEEGLRVRGTGAVEDAHVADLLDLVGGVKWYFEMWRGRADGRMTGSVSIAGPIRATTSLFDLGLDEVRLLGRPFGRGAARFRIDDGARLVLSEVHLAGPAGALRASGSVRFEGDNDVRFRLEGVPLDVVARPGGEGLDLGGRAKVDAHLRGTPEHPKGEATLTAARVSARGVMLGDAAIRASLDGTAVTFGGSIGSDIAVAGTVQLREKNPFELTVDARLPDVLRFVGAPRLPGPLGAFKVDAAGRLSLRGRVRDPSTLAGQVSLDSVRAQGGDLMLKNDGAVAAFFDGEAFGIRSLLLKGPAAELSASGGRDPAGQLDLSVLASFGAEQVPWFLPDVERAAGRVTVSATVGGTSPRPTWAGTAEIAGVSLALRDYPFAAKALSGRVAFSQSRILAQRLAGTINDGRASLDADVEILPPDAQGRRIRGRTRVSLGMDQANVRWLDLPPATLSGHLHLCDGRQHDENCDPRRQPTPAVEGEDLLLAGAVEVNRFRYTKDIDIERALFSPKARGEAVAAIAKPRASLRFNVAVQADGSVQIDNNVARLKLQGNVRLAGTDVRPGLVGSLSALEGGRAFYRGNDFSITHGLVEFKERDRIESTFDVHAQAQVRDHRVFVHAFGSPEAPHLQFTSDPDRSQADIVSLLTFGVTSFDKGAASSVAYRAGGQLLLQATGLDREVNRFTSKNPILKDVRVQLSTNYSDTTGQVEPTAQLEAKLLLDRLNLRMRQPLTTTRGRQLQAEYLLNEGGAKRPSLSVQMQWDNEATSTSFGDLGVDLKLRWEAD